MNAEIVAISGPPNKQRGAVHATVNDVPHLILECIEDSMVHSGDQREVVVYSIRRLDVYHSYLHLSL